MNERKTIPATEYAPVVRTDFSDERVWQGVCRAIEAPIGAFRAYVTFVSDPAFEGITAEEVVERAKQDAGFVFIVDGLTMSHPEHPILVVDLWDVPGRTFRVIPSEMWGVENNLSLANMDFEEFAENTDCDGIFRGFQD
jgi:hypothetical protein